MSGVDEGESEGDGVGAGVEGVGWLAGLDVVIGASGTAAAERGKAGATR